MIFRPEDSVSVTEFAVPERFQSWKGVVHGGLKPETRRPLKRPADAVMASGPGATGARLRALRATRVNATQTAQGLHPGLPLISVSGQLL